MNVSFPWELVNGRLLANRRVSFSMSFPLAGRVKENVGVKTIVHGSPDQGWRSSGKMLHRDSEESQLQLVSSVIDVNFEEVSSLRWDVIYPSIGHSPADYYSTDD